MALFAVTTLVGCPEDDGAGTVDDTFVPADTRDTRPDIPSSSATLVVDPERIDFGTWTVGDGQFADLELENAGSEAILVTRIAFAAPTGEFAANLIQTEIPAGETRLLKVSFFAATEGSHADTLLLDTNAINGPTLMVAVSGVAGLSVCQDIDGDGYGVGCPLGDDCDEDDNLTYEGAPERCNTDDDDCDGLFDEDFVGLGTPCSSGVGECTRTGIFVCDDDALGVICSADAGAGDAELCNDIDDDCDGLTDESFPSKGALCAVGEGACKVVDKFTCNAAETGLACPVVALSPGLEVCDDLVDNDCDGVTDEGQIEVCADNIDNDCDGETDESGSRWGEVFAARNSGDETVAVYISKGDGTFEPPLELDFPGSDRFGVLAVGDFDGDRWLDLVVEETVVAGRTLCSTNTDCLAGQTCASGVCRKLCTNTGDCTLFPTEECVDTRSPNIPNDTFCLPPRTVYLATSSCDPTDPDAIGLTPLFTLEPGEQVGTVADVDGDGQLDFVGLAYFKDAKDGILWLNDSTGPGSPAGFTRVDDAFDYGPLFGAGLFGHWEWGLTPTGRDLNGDGYVDVLGQSQATTGAQPTDFWVLFNDGAGGFLPMVSLGATIPLPANLTAVDDFDGDGDQDIVAGLDADGMPGTAWMLANLATVGTTSQWVLPYSVFDVAPMFNGGSQKPGLGQGASYDFDGDDRPDVLAAYVPEECGAFIAGCTDVQDPMNLCFGGDCRRLAFLRNRTGDACDAGSSCVAGQCVTGCTADCAGKQCGSDGCGGSCGACQPGQVCAGGQCVVDCVPDCSGKQCGPNGCGGTCGLCQPGFVCAGGVCDDDCIPDCAGKMCGSDGCGGTCVAFDPPVEVAFDANPQTTLRAPTNVPPTAPGVGIDPQNPSSNVDLSCVILVPSYDLDPVSYRYEWLKNGVFQAAASGRSVIAAAETVSGDAWTCQVRAEDGLERSPVSEATATVN